MGIHQLFAVKDGGITFSAFFEVLFLFKFVYIFLRTYFFPLKHSFQWPQSGPHFLGARIATARNVMRA